METAANPRFLRVLVADDDDGYSALLITLLQSDPRIVVVGRAADGTEAVDLAIGLRPDAVVMDINMPRLDGFEATARIRQELPRVRVIVVTAVPHGEHMSRARAAGAGAYLPKDAGVGALLSALLDEQPRSRMPLAG